MARTATTADAFNAVAEESRREIIDVLAEGETTVSALVVRLHLAQPQVSKHLAVLRAVDLVHSRAVGKNRIYRLNPEALRPIRDWLAGFEQLWSGRLDRLAELLPEIEPDPSPPESPA